MKKSLLLLLVLGLFACSEIENVDVFIDSPTIVQLDDDFEITMKLVNTANKSQKLVSIDISDKYLKGVIVAKTAPEYKESTHIPIDNSMSYIFRHSLPPGDTVTVTLYCKAVDTGDFSGSFDFCINSDFNFMSKNVRTLIKDNE